MVAEGRDIKRNGFRRCVSFRQCECWSMRVLREAGCLDQGPMCFARQMSVCRAWARSGGKSNSIDARPQQATTCEKRNATPPPGPPCTLMLPSAKHTPTPEGHIRGWSSNDRRIWDEGRGAGGWGWDFF